MPITEINQTVSASELGLLTRHRIGDLPHAAGSDGLSFTGASVF